MGAADPFRTGFSPLRNVASTGQWRTALFVGGIRGLDQWHYGEVGAEDDRVDACLVFCVDERQPITPTGTQAANSSSSESPVQGEGYRPCGFSFLRTTSIVFQRKFLPIPIITEKEQSLLRDLREEEKRILNPMEIILLKILESVRIILEEILKLKEQMDQKDSVMFLKEESRRNRRISDDVQELSVTDEALPVGKFYHPYLLNTGLREKLDAIKRVSVTLDVETANPDLEVSEDRKSVRRSRTRRNLPITWKRFTHWQCVLGSEGFTSGRHYWEVEVTGNQFWCLGVAAESVARMRSVRLRPETGFWVIERD
ncbi:zinc-binding protein A33-like [Hemitrygon akajei]|uniref:zinc-binding protein A33-like n=1 Tax=Hemitrygon akajei TaxID=2704970 RepID=UPI003BF9C90A